MKPSKLFVVFIRAAQIIVAVILTGMMVRAMKLLYLLMSAEHLH